MASIKARKSKDGKRSFLIRCMVNGVTHTRTYPGKTDPQIPETWSDKRALTEATKVAALFEEACRNNIVSNDRRTVSEYAHYILDHKAANKAIKPSTVAGYSIILDRIDEHSIAKVKLKDLTPRHLNDFYKILLSDGANKRTGKPLSPKTVHEYHVFLSMVLNEAIKENIISTNPAERAMAPKVEQKEPKFYPPEQMIKIINALKTEPAMWQAMSALFIGIGARRGEILGLRWSDIDFDNNRIFIRRNITRTHRGKPVVVTPKSDRWRVVSLSSEFMTSLLAWREEQFRGFGFEPKDGYVFAYKGPEVFINPDSITSYYDKLGRKYELGHLNPHAFRHSQASIILQSGDVVAASKRLGHAKASTTMNIYGHMMPAADREAADRVATAFLEAPIVETEKNGE